jgi:hypothetical protein
MRETEGGMNREKKIIMEKLILQEKNRYNNKIYSLLGKISGLIAVASSPDIGAWYSGLCREGCCPSGHTAWEEMAFFSIPSSYELSITRRSSELFSPND